MTRTAHRFRLAVVCLGLVVLAFVQDPGRIAADTKLDLTLDPWGFLSRALHLWDPSGFFGQVQNQAYGYFFPMGPLFGIGSSIDIPGWVIQRIWWSIVLITGFLGMVRLLRHLSVRSTSARILAALGYVLSARFVTTLGPISSETWPAALMPWALVPLVDARVRSPRARAARSAVPVLLAGGVNAVATLTLLVLPGLWLVTRRWNRDLLVLIGWWVAAIAAACLWWVIPLLTLGAVSPPFLDWIESSAITTRFTDVGSILRGTSSWVPYLTDPSGPVWDAGWRLVTTPGVVGAQVVLAVLGLIGIARWRGPQRWFLSLALLTGLVLVGLGHVGPVSGLGSEALRTALDGALAPFRNTHKFQPVVTVVLAVGLAGALDRVPALVATWRPSRAVVRAGVTAALAVGALVVVAIPAWTGGLTRDRSYVVVPSYWREAANWLADSEAEGTALVVPGASFADFLWGRSQDEPLQGLARTPWAVRDAVPLSSAGNIRLLDEVEARIEAGQGSAGLTEALARSGVRYVVVRNDLDQVATGTPRRGLVRRALRQSEGMTLAATFGPQIQGFQTGEIVSPEAQELPYPAVEIWAVDTGLAADESLGTQRVALRDAASAVTVAGGPESLLALGDAGQLPAGPLFLQGDTPDGVSTPLIVTDTPRRTEVAFGLARNNRTSTLTQEDPYQVTRAANDYVVSDATTEQSVAEPTTGVTLSSSGSRADVSAPRALDPGSAPGAALDGDLATAWRSPLGEAEGSWLQLDLGAETDLAAQSLEVAFVADGTTGARPATVLVQTAAGEARTELLATEDLQPVNVPSGTSTWLRLMLEQTADRGRPVSFGVREVALDPGSGTSATGSGGPTGVRVPSPSGDADTVVLTARTGERSGCVLVGLADACDPFLARQGEEHTGVARTVDVPAQAEVAVRVRPRAGAALDDLLRPTGEWMSATATSQAVDDPAGRADAAIDRDLGTTWVAGAHDSTPTVTLSLPEARTVTGLLFLTSPGAPASSPFQVTVETNGSSTTYFTSSDGQIDLPPTDTDEVSLTFGFTSPRKGPDPVSGGLLTYPVGVGEIVLVGADDLRPAFDAAAPVVQPCGSGPDVQVGDVLVPTRIETTAGAVLDGRVVDAVACDHAAISGGTAGTVTAESTPEFLVDQVTLTGGGAGGGSAGTDADQVDQPVVRSWAATERTIELPGASGTTVLEVGENFNAGWAATLDGVVLDPVRVDGWRQGWVVPAGATGLVTATFTPDSTYRLGLLLGLLVALGVVLMAVLPTRAGRGRAVPPAARANRWVQVGVLGAAMTVLAGITGLIVWVVAAAVPMSRTRRTVVLAAAGVVLAAVAVLWTWPAGPPTWAEVLGSIGALVAVALAARPDRGAAISRPTVNDSRSTPEALAHS